MKVPTKQIILDSGNWSPLSFTLIDKLGFKSAVVLSFLLHQEDFWASIGKLQPDGSFYVTQECMKKWLNMGPTTQNKLLNSLSDNNLIKIKYGKIPGKMQSVRIVKINREMLKKFMHPENGCMGIQEMDAQASRKWI